MKTTHRIFYQSSTRMASVPAESVDLVVTSPPYPMIEMWDDMFCAQNPAVEKALAEGDGRRVFELMHEELDQVWAETYRVLRQGGIACINIGDATRTLNKSFCLYPNHSRVLQRLLSIGYHALPDILWRKQTNAPNKFMGSGMLPVAAYVTLEHEYVLIVRKGPNRKFVRADEKKGRRESAFFWEERNAWFSDVWMDVKGARQDLRDKAARKRSAAYPFEVAYRLISMFSAKGDTVLDPFLGTGTTTAAAMAAGRNSIGFETDSALRDAIHSIKDYIVDFGNKHIAGRIDRHIDFVARRTETKGQGAFKHVNKPYGFPVMTRQERELVLNELASVKDMGDDTYEVSYSEMPQARFSNPDSALGRRGLMTERKPHS